MFPKPKRGSGKAARRARKLKLDKHRREVNRIVLERAGYICEREECGNPATHSHHVWGRGRSPEDWREQPKARLALCEHPCHDAVHARGTISREELIEDLERILAQNVNIKHGVNK